jgi:streptogramin lyase
VSNVTLSIDFGTSNTAAAYRDRHGAVRELRLSTTGSLMPSGVFYRGGQFLVGKTAKQAAFTAPEAFEPTPKRRLADREIYLGAGDPVSVTALVAAVFEEVLKRARQTIGAEPAEIVITHPDQWAAPMQDLLKAAAQAGGVDPGRLRLVSEAQAAAWFYATRTAEAGVGSRLVVFDFGAGTCDVAVLDAQPNHSFAVVAADGVDGLGGQDLDARIHGWVRAQLALTDPVLLAEISDPTAVAVQLNLKDRIQDAKEALSEASSVSIVVAGTGSNRILQLTRDEFDELIAPDITRAVDLAKQVIATANTQHPGAPQTPTIYLTGGSSAIPLVHARLSELGPLAVLDDPKTVVVQGALSAPHTLPTPALGAKLGGESSKTIGTKQGQTSKLADPVTLDGDAFPPPDPVTLDGDAFLPPDPVTLDGDALLPPDDEITPPPAQRPWQRHKYLVPIIGVILILSGIVFLPRIVSTIGLVVLGIGVVLLIDGRKSPPPNTSRPGPAPKPAKTIPTKPGQTPKPADPAPPKPNKQRPWRRRTYIAVTVVVIILLIAAGNYAYQRHRRATDQPSPAPGADATVLPFTGVTDPLGLAVDTAGDVYVSDSVNNGRVLKLEGGSNVQTELPFTPLVAPFGVAVDDTGAVYVAELAPMVVNGGAKGQVLKLAAGSSDPTVLPFTGLGTPSGVAVDGTGTVYVTDSDNRRVLKLAAGSSTQTVLRTDLSSPRAVAVDTAGDVYVTDTGNERVEKLAAGSSDQTELPFTDLSNPQGVAVDTAGDVYVTDTGNERVLKLAAGSSAQTELRVGGIGLAEPYGVAVDGTGAVYVADSNHGRVLKLAAQ